MCEFSVLIHEQLHTLTTGGQHQYKYCQLFPQCFGAAHHLPCHTIFWENNELLFSFLETVEVFHKLNLC